MAVRIFSIKLIIDSKASELQCISCPVEMGSDGSLHPSSTRCWKAMYLWSGRPRCLPFQNTATFSLDVVQPDPQDRKCDCKKVGHPNLYGLARVRGYREVYLTMAAQWGGLRAFASLTFSLHTWQCWFWALAVGENVATQWILLEQGFVGLFRIGYGSLMLNA